MVDLHPFPRAEPRLVTSDQLLRRALVLLATEHPDWPEIDLYRLLIAMVDEAWAELTARDLPLCPQVER